MEVGIREAKASLSKLITEVQNGKRIFVTNHGKRVAELGSAAPAGHDKESLGFGLFKEKIRLPSGWDSQKARRMASKQTAKLMALPDE